MMAKKGTKYPARRPLLGLVRLLLNAPLAGVIGAATLSKMATQQLTVSTTVGGYALTTFGACAGFGLGYGFMRVAQWLRWRAIQLLLGYHGWVRNPKARSSKVSGQQWS